MDDQQIEEYRKLCEDEIKAFLNGKFINYDPFDVEDATLILDAVDRSKRWLHAGKSYLSETKQFCSLMRVDGVITKIYHLDKYVEALKLHPMNYKGEEEMDIPFNHFQYAMMLDKGLNEPFDQSKAKYACCYDGKHDQEEIMSSIPGLILYSYHIGGITKFNQKRNVYRLSHFTKETLPDVIRTEMVRGQALAWRYFIQYPEYCRPKHSDIELPTVKAGKIMREEYEKLIFQIFEKEKEITPRLHSHVMPIDSLR